MKYNFDKELDRINTNDLKWNVSLVKSYLDYPIREDMIPMWVADTDFACPPVILEALSKRLNKEVLGYCSPLKGFYNAIKYWEKRRFDWEIEEKWVSAIPTVVSGINIAIRTFSNPGDGVIIQTPVYDPFTSIVQRCERKVINNQLVCKNGYYEINFDELQELAAVESNKIMILCSPHNPVGRVWSAEELKRVADICLENNVVLISDEIHSDIVYKGYKHYPVLNLDKKYEKNIIHLSAPSKSFNIPGLKMAYAIIPNVELKKEFDKTQVAMSLDVKNTFGIEGVTAAYTPEGEEWLEEEIEYMQGNIKFLEEFIREKLPKVKIGNTEGTFLCWLDCSNLGLSDNELVKRVVIDAGVVCVPGTWFGKGGEQHIRLNIGCTRRNLELALERIKGAIS